MMLHRNIGGAHLFAYPQPIQSKSYSVLKSARVKHLLELYWRNVHFLTPSNIKFLHTPKKIKCFT